MSETIELMEDMVDIKAAKVIEGKDIPIEQYLQKSGL